MLFGDLQNDWVVGGSGRDILFLGWGDDLGNLDDRLDTDNGLNDVATDTNPSYEDVVFGGAGRDAMLGNTGGDREIDWSGEFNSFMGAFNPYGQPATSRLLNPGLDTYLSVLAASAGADLTLAARHGTDPARYGEPYGELGIVTSSDPQWGDQKGGSRDPQPGTGNATRDVRISAGTQIIQAPGTSGQGTLASPTVHAPAYVNATTVTAVPVVIGGPAGFTALVTVTDGTHVVSGSGIIGGNGQLTLSLDLTQLNDGRSHGHRVPDEPGRRDEPAGLDEHRQGHSDSGRAGDLGAGERRRDDGGELHGHDHGPGRLRRPTGL